MPRHFHEMMITVCPGFCNFKTKEPSKEGKTGVLSDGRKVTVRVDSSDKRPTLEVQPQPGNIGKYIKIRYRNKG